MFEKLGELTVPQIVGLCGAAFVVVKFAQGVVRDFREEGRRVAKSGGFIEYHRDNKGKMLRVQKQATVYKLD